MSLCFYDRKPGFQKLSHDSLFRLLVQAWLAYTFRSVGPAFQYWFSDFQCRDFNCWNWLDFQIISVGWLSNTIICLVFLYSQCRLDLLVQAWVGLAVIFWWNSAVLFWLYVFSYIDLAFCLLFSLGIGTRYSVVSVSSAFLHYLDTLNETVC
jgi:hypothetical protein